MDWIFKALWKFDQKLASIDTNTSFEVKEKGFQSLLTSILVSHQSATVIFEDEKAIKDGKENDSKDLEKLNRKEGCLI